MKKLLMIMILGVLIGCATTHFNVDKDSIKWDRERIEVISKTNATSEFKELAKNFEVKVGMSEELVVLSLGEPLNIYLHEDMDGLHKQFVYKDFFVFIGKNGKTTTIRDLKYDKIR